MVVVAVLISTALTAAEESGRGARPQAAVVPTHAHQPPRRAPSQNAPTLRPLPESQTQQTQTTPPRQVRSADWMESTDGAADGRLRRVVPVAGASADGAGPTAGKQRAGTTGSRVEPAAFNVPAAEPLSRLTFAGSADEIDPAQTLRDWAEGAGLLLAFVVVALWLLRQWLTRRDLPGGAMSHLRTIESLSLPQRCRIHLVDVNGRQVLVAADAAGVKSVTVLPDRFAHLLDATDEIADASLSPPVDPSDATRSSAWAGLPESRPA